MSVTERQPTSQAGPQPQQLTFDLLGAVDVPSPSAERRLGPHSGSAPGSWQAHGLVPDVELVAGVEFHPAVARWFRQRFGQPTPPQREGWPSIAAGRNTLIAAPTGSGKTLAGFLMAINRLYLGAGLTTLSDGPATSVVYVSPLKALAVDIAENLERPLAEIADIAASMGLAVPNLTVGVRTGDTPAGERQAMVRKPRSFLVTTPESLYLMVTAAASRQTLRTVETVIVDEIHALARDKRGAHLALTLERLAHVCDRPPGRVGLSATQRPIETVAKMLVGSNRDEGLNCEIVDSGHQRALDVAIQLPDGELEAVASHSQMDWVLDHIADLIEQHRTTLVFVNTRRLAERLAHQLAERLEERAADNQGPGGDQATGDGTAVPADTVAAHHGSLSKDRRHRVERRLRAGELKALVATASLELGIDVGPVELVCQIGSPRSIATFLQRVGRSNHTRHGTPKGRLYPLTRNELVECSALLAAVEGGRLDAVHPPVAPLDILAQQVVAETGADEWNVDDLFSLVTRAHHYCDLPRSAFDEIITLVSEGIMTGRGRRAAWVHHDGINHELRGRRGARYVALTSGGAIPDIYDMRVIAEPDETYIGSVNEDWAMESSAGDIFLLGTHSWRIRQVTGGEVRVIDAGDAPPTVPFWTGEAPARTDELSDEVSRLREAVDRFLAEADPDGARRWLTTTCGIDDAAASTIVAYLATARAALGRLPSGRCLIMERFFDDADGMQLVIHSPLGGRVNRAMGYALRKKFCVGFNFELQAAASDDAVVISLGPHHSFPLQDVQKFLRPEIITETLTQAVLDQPAFQSRWRWNLNRSLIVQRMRNGKRNPPPIQRMESDDLLAALFPDAAACQENVSGPISVPDHPIVNQTIHDTLTEGLDVDGLIELWAALGRGDVEMLCIDTTEPSVLAHEILTASPYAFLDDDELPDRRTRAVPLRRGLPVDVSDLATLVPEAIESVRAELTPDPRSPDELHDLLTDTVVLQPQHRWQHLFDELQQAGRVSFVSSIGDGRTSWWWCAAELLDAAQVLLTDSAIDELFPEQVAADALRGHLELLSPATPDELAEAAGIGPTTLKVALATLESQGIAIQGRFTPTAQADDNRIEWCSRRLLARMHARSRTTRRHGIEPIAPEQFLRFQARWQHVAPGNQLNGPEGLRRILDQLQGWGAAVAAWEPQLLTARLGHYDPQWIDRLCRDGEIQWLRLRPGANTDEPHRATAGPSKATPISLVYRHDLPWLLPTVRGDTVPCWPELGALAEVAEVLAATGTRFATELATDTGRLISDVERALWEGVACGLFTADGFEAIRSLTSTRRRQPSGSSRPLSRLRRGVASPAVVAGRWALVAGVEPRSTVGGDGRSADDDRARPDGPEPDQLAEALADQLLQRWGILFYDLVALERPALRWRELQWALRRLEDRGLVRGGRFVKGFSGEQFALPQAVDVLDDVRRSTADGRTVRVCGSDPLNLTGVIAGTRIPARRTATVDIPL